MMWFFHSDIIDRCSNYGWVSQQHVIPYSIILIVYAIVTIILVCFPVMSDVPPRYYILIEL